MISGQCRKVKINSMNDPVFVIVVGLALGGLGVVFGYIIARKRKE